MTPLSERVLRLAASRTVAVDTLAKRLVREGRDIAVLAAGEPEGLPPALAREAAITAIRKGLTRYSDPAGLPDLRAAICEKLKQENGLQYTPDEIVISAGAKQAVFQSLLALVNPGDEVLIPTPCWVTYPELVRLCGGVAVPVPTRLERGWRVGVRDLAPLLTPRTKAIILNSPGNPTGAVYSREELAALGRWIVRNGLYCISDEIYEHMIYGHARHVSVPALSPELRERTLLVNGLSKAYAMTGWRIGYTAAPREISGALARLQGQAVHHPAMPSQYAALAALKSGGAFPRRLCRSLDKKRTLVSAALRGIPDIRWREPEGAFYFLVDIGKYLDKPGKGARPHNSEELCALLLEKFGVATVPGSAFEAEGYLRISFTAPTARLRQGMRRLAQGLGALR